MPQTPARQREYDAEPARKARKSVTDAQRHKLKKYGLTPEEYDQMLAEQGGGCAICNRKDDRRLAVDHDHKTGQVRALLCTRCNTALGMVNDSKDHLLDLVNYLGRF